MKREYLMDVHKRVFVVHIFLMQMSLINTMWSILSQKEISKVLIVVHLLRLKIGASYDEKLTAVNPQHSHRCKSKTGY